MNDIAAGNRIDGHSLDKYMALASSDNRIVAFAMHPTTIMATFFTYLEGTTSPSSDSWPVFVREDLLLRKWRVGSYVDFGDIKDKLMDEAPSPIGKYCSKTYQS